MGDFRNKSDNATASGRPPIPMQDAGFEKEPLTRQEYLGVMTHFYRAEAHRSTVWRQRIDATTNWAVLTCAGMLSFAFANPHNSHFLLLVSNLVIFAYMVIEARRYRRFEVYQARLRMLEENFLLPIVSHDLISPKESWRQEVCGDLHRPTYKSKLLPSLGLRLRRNYGFIFAILAGAWMLKLEMHPTLATSFDVVWSRMAVGRLLPPAAILIAGILFYGSLIVFLIMGLHIHGTGPADEVTGLESHPERWNI